MVVGRYRQGGETTLTLDGEVNGRPQRFRYDGMAFQRDGGQEFIARLWATRKIGYLLQQIRLHGEERELIDEVVDLSIRYGIITPYTSFLVEETEMALSEEGRETLADEMWLQATAVPAPAHGAQAVERSAKEKVLSEAEAPAAAVPSGLGGGETDEYGYEISPIKYVGAKTFVLQDSVWTDTTFDPGKMEPVSVSFGSDDYFDLVTNNPGWGRYFALGDPVIVVLEGTAYEVRAGDALPVEKPAGEPAPVPGTSENDSQDQGGTALEIVLALVEEIASFFEE